MPAHPLNDHRDIDEALDHIVDECRRILDLSDYHSDIRIMHLIMSLTLIIRAWRDSNELLTFSDKHLYSRASTKD
jgi:hypothetical protein